MALSEVLKSKHAIEAQEDELKRKKEQLQLDAEIAASTAKIAILQASDKPRTGDGSSSSKSK